MLTFLTPLGWAAAVALLVPLILHWLSRGRARRIELGSVRLFTETALSRRRALRFHHPLLFVVRCLLVLALAAVLAQPRARGPLASFERAPRLVVEREVLTRRAELEAANPELFARLDARLREGAEPTMLDVADPPWDLWSLLREVDGQTEPGRPIEVFAIDRLAGLSGERPALAREVSWWSAQDPASGAGAWALVSGARGAGGAPRTVLIAADPDRSEDARYVAAAVEAAGLSSGREVTLHRVALDPAAKQAGSWVDGVRGYDLAFWLSSRAAPEAQAALELGAIWVSDAGDRWESVEAHGWVPPDVRWEPVSLHRLEVNGPPIGSAEAAPVAPLWRDAVGRYLLEAGRADAGALRLRFRSRFHPAWTGLVRHPYFVEWVEGLLAAPGEEASALHGELAHPAAHGRDTRAAGAGVAAPARLAGPADAGRFPYGWPESAALALAALLFLLERALVYKEAVGARGWARGARP